MSEAIMIPHSRPFLDGEDYRGVLDVLRSETFCQEIDLPGAVAVSSGTAALHLTLLALGVGIGDEVILPSYVCTALWHAVRYTGATPVLADIEADAFNLSALDVMTRMTKKTKAIIVPHMFGQSADINELLNLGIPIIEDCAQSLGNHYRGQPTGTFGAAAIFSFYATKVIAAGEGGMVVSRDRNLIDRIRDMRDYDEKETLTQSFNYKLTDLQAALGMSQLKKLSVFIARRQDIARRYDCVLRDANLPLPINKPDREHSYFRYVFLLDSMDRFINDMGRLGVVCRRPVFRPLHDYLGQTDFEVTNHVWRRAVSVPIYPGLTDEEVETVVLHMKTLLSKG
ncbi:MAG: DegT/DnrJ/EryC1/StrS family aminotransferase [Deltaproteobacteria bacterium]|nr:DegT/DnrJ/EryC1/StrS family aminotransferase [Deltaproteobacteria bacterium]